MASIQLKSIWAISCIKHAVREINVVCTMMHTVQKSPCRWQTVKASNLRCYSAVHMSHCTLTFMLLWYCWMVSLWASAC